MAGPIDPGLRKVHVSLNVSALAPSIAVYRVLLGAEPAKVQSDYAKFDLADPPLVLSLMPGGAGTPARGPLNHAGLRVRNVEELVELQRRLEAAGITTRREDGVACCHSTQTKFWVADPDGALWEIYVFLEDIDGPEHVHEAPPASAAWSHHLGSAIPERIPLDDDSAGEVRLEGSINVFPASPHRRGLFGEVRRVLRPA